MIKQIKNKIMKKVEIILIVILFGLSIWYMSAQWNECIKMGMSKFYCIQHTFE